MFKKNLYLILITLTCWWILLSYVNSLDLHLRNTYGVISRVVIEDRSPFTNIAIYLILFLIPSLVILLIDAALYNTTKVKFKLQQIKVFFIKIFESKTYLPLLLLTLIGCWILNATQPMMTPGLVNDGFHYGEKIGLSIAFLNNPKNFFNEAYVLIHGFGLNVLPGIIGFYIGGYEKDVAASFFALYSQFLLAIIFSFAILFELAAYISKDNKWKVLFLLSLVYFALYNIILAPIDRDTVFFIQAFLTIRWLRLIAESNFKNSKNLSFNFIYPGLIGFSIPLSIFYVYDRATYFIAIYLCLLGYVAIVKDKRFFIKTFLISIASLLLSSLFFSFILGFNFLPVSLSQITYWAKFSGLFTSLPYPTIRISILEILNWLPIFLQSITLSILLLKLRVECFGFGKKIQVFLLENGVTIFLLLCAMLMMRVALGRSDGGHIVSPGFFAVFSFIVAIAKTSSIQNIYTNYWFTTLTSFIVICSFINLSSVTNATDIFNLRNYPLLAQSLLTSTNSELINPQYQEAAMQLKEDIGTQQCFYTLTSEGIWYRIFQLKPCSKYWYLIYSTSTSSQQELVKDLQQQKPRIILYSNKSLGNGIDGVAKETSHLLVHQYIWQNYRPYKYINDNWFWISRETETELSEILVPKSNTIGFFDRLTSLESNNKLDVMASGWSLLPLAQTPHENAIFLTYNLVDFPTDLKLLSVGSTSIYRPDVVEFTKDTNSLTSGWNLYFNKLNLPLQEKVNIRAWAYNATDQKLHEIPTSSPKTMEGQ
ncbi:hypothetical protein [Gloeocapsopsis dulcis]|uniref:Uncharacterized protein n=1 Tax=Gloeocapsopsis dulcis AAB1 = 1H9 TaxID=1433147 RepID=A0A6N8FUB1_9CHRO|nr:hypothetical protein [Gloeocapsopsis dulcis]MUL36693.1 hypothetical protein [Gloeocapsopsis dulcis AAB1 = 1H9]WNN91267.1 hypothetical protein P0S91_09435 [Gloeocapsopsis dulcis]